MDKGPWSVALDRDGRAFAVQSEDFEHDVLLRVSGDFADDAQRLAYCEWLAATLNAGEKHAEIAPLTPVEETTKPHPCLCEDGSYVHDFRAVHDLLDRACGIRRRCVLCDASDGEEEDDE